MNNQNKISERDIKTLTEASEEYTIKGYDRNALYIQRFIVSWPYCQEPLDGRIFQFVEEAEECVKAAKLSGIDKPKVTMLEWYMKFRTLQKGELSEGVRNVL